MYILHRCLKKYKFKDFFKADTHENEMKYFYIKRYYLLFKVFQIYVKKY